MAKSCKIWHPKPALIPLLVWSYSRINWKLAALVVILDEGIANKKEKERNVLQWVANAINNYQVRISQQVKCTFSLNKKPATLKKQCLLACHDNRKNTKRKRSMWGNNFLITMWFYFVHGWFLLAICLHLQITANGLLSLLQTSF